MPIATADLAVGATPDEASNFLNNAIDGIMGPWDALNAGITVKEAKYSQLAIGVAGVAVGSIFARKNAKKNQKPVLGIFF